MANFTSQDIMKLRASTGVGMLDCKKALEATDGDMDAAVKYLREKGIASAAKKATRIAAEGIVYCASNNKASVIVEVNCETDFVAKSDKFVGLVDTVAQYILKNKIETAEQLVAEKAMVDLVAEGTAAIGEKISIRRFVKYDFGKNSVVDTYIHMGGKIGVMVELEATSANEQVKSLAHNLSMQIAAAKPDVVSVDDVDPVALNAEKEVFANQARNEGKPEAIIEKMIIGRVQKYYKEVCLLEQPYVKDDSQSVKAVIAQVAKEAGCSINVVKFVRLEMGQGIEKRVDNFADEIAEQLKNI